MGCATGIVKYLIFLFNFLFVVGGIALITFGALFYNGYKTYEEILPEFEDLGPYQFPPILMMVVGGIIFVIAFMGCCGTLRENRCMMMTYATLLFILLIAEVAIAVLIYTNQDEVKEIFKKQMSDSMVKYRDDTKVQEVWDTMQANLKCCGVENYKDWTKVGTERIPQSCCEEPGSSLCSAANYAKTLVNIGYFSEGCLNKIYNELKTEYAMYAAIILALVEIFGIVFGCCLGARFGRKVYQT